MRRSRTVAAGAEKSSSSVSSGLLDLTELQFHRRRAAKDRDRDAKLALVIVDVLHHAVKVGKGAFLDANRLAHFEEHLGLGLLDAFLHLVQDLLHLLLADRRRLAAVRPADAAGPLGR